MYAHGYHRSEDKRVASTKEDTSIAPGEEVDRLVYLRVPPCCPTFRCSLVRHQYQLHTTLHLPAGSFDLHVRLPTDIGTIPHAYPPLFSEQKAQAAEAARAAYAWANIDAIVAAAAQANASMAAAADVEYSDAYQGDEPSYASIPTNTQYAYFQMPMPSAPEMPQQAPGMVGSGEQTPLLGAGAPAPAPAQAPGMAPAPGVDPAAAGSTMAMPLSFGAPAQAYDIPKDR